MLWQITAVMAYNDKIIIQQRTDGRGDAGGVEETWSTYKTVWAEIDDLSGNKDNAADMPVYEDSMSFKIHTHDAPDVTTKMRISWESQYFYIRSKQRDGRLRTTLIADAYDDE
jgi:SPP1 family predicted phage head-tail adaptor